MGLSVRDANVNISEDISCHLLTAHSLGTRVSAWIKPPKKKSVYGTGWEVGCDLTGRSRAYLTKWPTLKILIHKKYFPKYYCLVPFSPGKCMTLSSLMLALKYEFSFLKSLRS